MKLAATTARVAVGIGGSEGVAGGGVAAAALALATTALALDALATAALALPTAALALAAAAITVAAAAGDAAAVAMQQLWHDLVVDTPREGRENASARPPARRAPAFARLLEARCSLLVGGSPSRALRPLTGVAITGKHVSGHLVRMYVRSDDACN